MIPPQIPVRDLDPLLIAAPVQRCGTTLLQRLLSSSPQTLIYGEPLAHDMDLLVSLLDNKRLLLRGDGHERQMGQVLAGDVNDWIPDLLPGGAWVVSHFEQAVATYLAAYAAFAARAGRPRWGVKAAGWSPAMLGQLLKSMPRARLIYVVRDLESVVRSAKLIGYCQDLPAVADFARAWRENQLLLGQACPSDRVLRVDYSELCASPDRIVPEIERFCDIRDVDRSVLDHRINTAAASGGYARPPSLSAEERALIASVVATADHG